MSAMETNDILDAVGRGNADAFMQIVRGYGLSIRSYLASQIYHVDDVDDIAQEVFITAYRRLGTFRRGEDMGAWLRGIARNIAMDHRSRLWRERPTDDALLDGIDRRAGEHEAGPRRRGSPLGAGAAGDGAERLPGGTDRHRHR